MKKCINPFTGKDDHKMNYREAAEHLGMSLSNLHYRFSKSCKLNSGFLPKRRVEYGKYFFYFTEVEHFEKNNRFAVPKPKADNKKDSKKSESAEIIKFNK